MKISLIVAAAETGVIGRQGQIPWRLPADFKHFKRTTVGHHVIMGRTTWESLPRPLPRRTNVVLSSRLDYAADGATVLSSLAAALELARLAGDDEAFIAGGTRVYAEALPLADRVYLTRVHAQIEGDASFPPLKPSDWVERARVEHEADERHPYAFTILTLERTDSSRDSTGPSARRG